MTLLVPSVPIPQYGERRSVHPRWGHIAVLYESEMQVQRTLCTHAYTTRVILLGCVLIRGRSPFALRGRRNKAAASVIKL